MLEGYCTADFTVILASSLRNGPSDFLTNLREFVRQSAASLWPANL